MILIILSSLVGLINLILFFNVPLSYFLISIFAQVLIYFVTYYFLESYLEKTIFDFESRSSIFRKIRYKLQQNIMDRERRVELGDKQSLEYQDILNSLDLKLGIIDTEFNLIFVNNKFKEVFKLDKADNLKTDLRDLAFTSDLKDVIENKEKIFFEWHRTVPDNQYYDVVAFPINNFFLYCFKKYNFNSNVRNGQKRFCGKC